MSSSPEVNELIVEGWPTNEQQLRQLLGPMFRPDVTHLRKYLLDTDIRNFGVPLLNDRINKKIGEFKGPLILQVIRLRNVSYPRYSESVHNDGLIKLQLTDGHNNIQALQFEPIPKLNSETTPGTKIRLVGKIPIENGMLLINGSNCRVLGGIVTQLIEKWNLDKNWLEKPSRYSDRGAPKWIPFSKHKQIQGSRTMEVTNKSFRANDAISGVNTVNKNDEDFNLARRTQIEQAIGKNASRQFAQNQAVSSQVIASTSNKRENFAKVQSTQSYKKFESIKENERCHVDQSAKIENTRGGNVYRQSASVRTFEPSNSQYRRNYSVTDYPNTASANFRRNYAENCEPVKEIIRGMADFNLSLKNLTIDATPQGDNWVSARHSAQSGGIKNYYSSADKREPGDKISSSDDSTADIFTPWKVGQKCLAPWSDGQFYMSTLIALGPADMCTVEYDDYGNRSSVPVGTLVIPQNFYSGLHAMSMSSRYFSKAAKVIKAPARRQLRSPITLTSRAVDRIKHLIAANPQVKALKIGVKKRGCSGLTYTFEYAEEKAKSDEEVVQDGIRIWIDSKAQLTILGSEMDYIEDRLSSEFVFRNPNIKGTCGCGESFNV